MLWLPRTRTSFHPLLSNNFSISFPESSGSLDKGFQWNRERLCRLSNFSHHFLLPDFFSLESPCSSQIYHCLLRCRSGAVCCDVGKPRAPLPAFFVVRQCHGNHTIHATMIAL